MKHFSNVPPPKTFPIFNQKNVDDSQAVDSDLRCSKLLCEEACFNILNKIPCIM